MASTLIGQGSYLSTLDGQGEDGSSNQTVSTQALVNVQASVLLSCHATAIGTYDSTVSVGGTMTAIPAGVLVQQ